MRIKYLFVFLALLLACPAPARAASVTPEDLLGEYDLVAIQVSNSYGTFNTANFSGLDGRASVTTKGLVLEMSGYNATLGSVYYYACGFYSLWASSDRMTVSIVGETPKTVNFSMSGNTFTTTWSDTIEGVNTTIICSWQKNKSYYSTQTQPAGDTKVIVIPMD